MSPFSSIMNSILFHAGSMLGAAFRRNYIRKARNGKKTSEKTLLKIINSSKNTVYGKKYNFSDIHSIEDFQKNVPLSLYDDYREYIEETVKNGTQNLITGHRIIYFAATSGTTTAKKLIPQTTIAFPAYFKVICIYLNDLVKALRSRSVSDFNAKGFLVTEMSNSTKEDNDDVDIGMISFFCANGFKQFVPSFTQLPKEIIGSGEVNDKQYIKSRYAIQDPSLNYIGGIFTSSIADSINYIEDNHEMLIKDIEEGIIDPSIDISDSMRNKLQSKLKPDPKRANELRKIFTTDSDVPLISRIWNNMSYICSMGSADFEPFTKRILSMCKDDVVFSYGAYAASEALMACAVKTDDPSYLLLVDNAFFEFVPADKDVNEVDRPLLINEVEVGKLYEIIVTNKSGLYRYKIRDVVRIIGFEGETPYIEFAYRANFVTDLCGAHITGEHLAAGIKAIEYKYDLNALDFSIYANKDTRNPHIDLFIELDRDINQDIIEDLEKTFDDGMRGSSWDYDYYRKDDVIKLAKLLIVKKGTYTKYRNLKISQGFSTNQLKAVRLIDNEEKLEYFRNAIQ